jgi:predicted Zn-dependent protease
MQSKMDEAIKARQSGQPAEALAILSELLKSLPQDPVLNYQMAWTCDTMGKESEAALFYERALKNGLSGEDRRGALLGLGSTFRCLGEYQRSKEIFDKAVDEFPADRSLRVFRAITLYNLGDAKSAVRELLKQLLDTTTDQTLTSYAKALRFYSDKLDETWK